MRSPFEVPFEEVRADLDGYVDEVSGALRSEFLTLPKGPGFVEYPVFEQGYEALKQATEGFRDFSPEPVVRSIYEVPIVFIVLRAMLGFTPPEWAYLSTQRTPVEVTQSAARALDRRIRLNPLTPLRKGGVNEERIRALAKTACELLVEGAPQVPGLLHERTGDPAPLLVEGAPQVPGLLHWLDKADTKDGLKSLQPLAALGVPYAMVLYERFLGRPFAGHRDSVSELVGDVLEAAVEAALAAAGISFRKTKRAERVAGFDQAPDFIIPDEFNPQVVIEAKVTEDDGTARDKVTRVQHLGELSMQGVQPGEPPRFEVIACIAGRGFRERREDMKKLLLSTRGKVFTLQNVPRLIDCSRLAEFRTR